MKKKLKKEEFLKIYKYMLRIRRFEERAAQLYGMGHIGGFCHLYIGQEAVVVGVLMTIEQNDSVVTTYRDHGHMIARGLDPKKIMSELTGRSSGYSGGKGGSMHMFSKKNNFYGGHGIVGAQVPIGTGIAFSHKYLNQKNICRTYIGDGAMNNGQVFEAFNLAALWHLPVLYIIENNMYGMGTAVDRAAAGSELYKRGEAFGIKGEIIDGMNVFKVIEAAQRAGDYVRSGNGPYILEVQTYRYRGHSMSDPAKYRTKEELDSYKSNDPLDIVSNEMIKKKFVSDKELEKINKKIILEIKEAADFALNSPFPSEDDLYTNVYL
jgi:pyruvate dehydrogenase E1 component alpha subunit